MNIFKAYAYLFKKYPLVRMLTCLTVISGICILVGTVGKKVNKKPQILKVTPLIGSPGETMTISGMNFGERKDSSFVEIAGSKITSSGFISWTNSEIKLVIPSNVQDGLVSVSTSAGSSEPAFFANVSGIPVAVKNDQVLTIPSVSYIEPANSASVGQTITIHGMNFGTARNGSKVWFTANREETLSMAEQASQQDNANGRIEANEIDLDYESWTENEIKVKVPDGAASGTITVETSKGTSQAQKYTVNFPHGKKDFHSGRTYVIQVTADISNHIASQDSSIMLYIPRPAVYSLQPKVQLNDIYPAPFISDDYYDIIHYKTLRQIINNKQRFSQTFVVNSYALKGNINPKAITAYKNKTSLIYKNATSPDNCVPSGDEKVVALAKTITEKTSSPYTKAKLIYEYMMDNFKLLEKNRKSDSPVTDLIKKKRGDPYDFAVIFTALCRASGIPSNPVAGVLVEEKGVSEPHWWSEIYFENYGWFPVDPALGAGKEFTTFVKVDKPREFYFGNMDNQHVTFSRGWKQILKTQINGKVVYKPRSYALQSIWEEAGDATSSYSSLWNTPAVIGIY